MRLCIRTNCKRAVKDQIGGQYLLAFPSTLNRQFLILTKIKSYNINILTTYILPIPEEGLDIYSFLSALSLMSFKIKYLKYTLNLGTYLVPTYFTYRYNLHALFEHVFCIFVHMEDPL